MPQLVYIIEVVRHISEHHKLPGYAKEALQPGSQQEFLFKKMNHSRRYKYNYSKSVRLCMRVQYSI